MRIARVRSRGDTEVMTCSPLSIRFAFAKRLECDEDKARFEAKLGKLAKAKPHDKTGFK